METSNTTFICQCAPGWQDVHCQTKINYCNEGTCLNNGVCQSILLNYTCHCLTESYSGRHCEQTANRIVILQRVSKSFAYIAIISMTGVALFVITMDVLKYFFYIDPVGSVRAKHRSRKRPMRKRKHTHTHPVPKIIVVESVE